MDFTKKIKFKYKAGMDAKGRLTALQGEILLDMGAYSCFSSEVLSRICLGAAGLYQCRHMDIQVKGYKSSNAPWLPPPSWGLSQGSFAMEVLANQLAIKSDQDPADWRRQNLPVKGNLNLS